jgi:FkbM family methyltransferase
MRWTVADGEHYERNVTEALTRIAHVLERPVFYDIGASYGFYTIKLAQAADWVYAFEPVTETFELLNNNIRRNRIENISTFKVGLFDEEADAPINLYSSSGSNSMVWALPDEHPAKLLGHETIHVVRLDDFAEREPLRPPDLIKLDVEGAELPALRGARRLIAASQPVLVLESLHEQWFDPRYSRSALLAELEDMGYLVAGLSQVFDDFELYPVEEFEQAKVVNLLALPRQRSDLLERLEPMSARLLRADTPGVNPSS